MLCGLLRGLKLEVIGDEYGTRDVRRSERIVSPFGFRGERYDAEVCADSVPRSHLLLHFQPGKIRSIIISRDIRIILVFSDAVEYNL